MRVAVYYNNKDVRLEERPVPEVGNGELLMKVMASGVCGSDVMEWYRIKKAPLVLGHEVAGEVVEVGDGVERFKKGDRIVVTHHVPCNKCRYCLKGHHSVCDTLRKTNFIPGGFSEYLKIPAINVDRGTFLLPDNLSYEEGTFVEPLACVLRGLRLSGFEPGQSILVIGSGISGLLQIISARALGAGFIAAVDVNDYRINSAKRFGADIALKADDDVPNILKKHNSGLLADMVILCTGAKPAILQSFKTVDKGGTVLLFAVLDPASNVELPLWDIYQNNIKITTSYAGAPQDLLQAIELFSAKRIDVKDMITHRLGLAETGKGFQLVADAKESIKVIIEPQR